MLNIPDNHNFQLVRVHLSVRWVEVSFSGLGVLVCDFTAVRGVAKGASEVTELLGDVSVELDRLATERVDVFVIWVDELESEVVRLVSGPGSVVELEWPERRVDVFVSRLGCLVSEVFVLVSGPWLGR